MKTRTDGSRPGKGSLDGRVTNALQLHRVGRIQEAEALYREVLNAQPNHAGAQHFLGLLLHQTNRRAQGLALIDRSVRSAKKNPDFLNNLGTVQLDHGLIDEAEKSFRRALLVEPNHSAAQANLASTLRQLGKFDAAVKIFRRAVDLNPYDKKPRISLAETLQQAGRLDDAIVVVHEGLAKQPHDAELNHRLGVVLLEKGDLSAAAKCFRAALSADPNMAEAWLMLSQIKKQREIDTELTAMETLHGRKPAGSLDRMTLSFGLGKAYEDLRHYDRAFDFFEEGNRICRRSVSYDERKTVADFANMKRTFNENLFQDKRTSDISDHTPIFVIGMPRSGTTLVEQIISSHPQVHGAGELNCLRHAIGEYFPMDMPGGFPIGIANLPKVTFSDAGRRYLHLLKQMGPGYKYITDKMPGNFLLVGFIHLMLPKAKIIHCVREPAATCLSIYKTYFRNSGHLYGYDLNELARFYNLYADIMAHWHRVLPGVVYDVYYERFISDQEAVSRKLIDQCGLSWDDACLHFHNSQRPVRTASVAQVRQPVYNSSIDLWRSYGDRLKPLFDNLTPASTS